MVYTESKYPMVKHSLWIQWVHLLGNEAEENLMKPCFQTNSLKELLDLMGKAYELILFLSSVSHDVALLHCSVGSNHHVKLLGSVTS